MFFLILTSACASTGPKVSMFVSPQMVSAGTKRVTITATVRVEKSNEELWCPAVEFQWGNGVTDIQESDCDPYDPTAIPELRGRWSETKSITFSPMVRGKYLVRIILRKAEKIIRVVEGFFEIH